MLVSILCWITSMLLSKVIPMLCFIASVCYTIILINWHSFIPCACGRRAFIKLLLCTFISQCLKVLVWPPAWRNDASPSDNGMSRHSLLLFHHLIASFCLFPRCCDCYSISDDLWWPCWYFIICGHRLACCIHSADFSNPSLLFALIDWANRLLKYYLQIPEDCTRTRASNNSQVWQKGLIWNKVNI